MFSNKEDQSSNIKNLFIKIYNDTLKLFKKRGEEEGEVKISLGSEERIHIPNILKWRFNGLPVEIYFDKEVYEGILTHAETNPAIEVGGILIGNVSQDDKKIYHIDVTGYIIAKETRGNAVSMTFSHESWDDIYKTFSEIEKDFPKKLIVGWYHTHPRHGIFLSGDDLHIHRNFFPNPYQIALVVDSNRDEGGFFIWRDRNIQSDVLSDFKFRLSNPYSPLPVQKIKHIQRTIKLKKRDLLKEEVQENLTNTDVSMKAQKVSLFERGWLKWSMVVIVSLISGFLLFKLFELTSFYTEKLFGEQLDRASHMFFSIITGIGLLLIILLLWVISKPLILKLYESINILPLQKPKATTLISIAIIFVVIVTVVVLWTNKQRRQSQEIEKTNIILNIASIRNDIELAMSRLRELKSQESEIFKNNYAELENILDGTSENISEVKKLIEAGDVNSAKEKKEEAVSLLKKVQNELDRRSEQIKTRETFKKIRQECKTLLSNAKKQGLWNYSEDKFKSLNEKVETALFPSMGLEGIEKIKQRINIHIGNAQERKKDNISKINSKLKKAENMLSQDYLKQQDLFEYVKKDSEFNLLNEEIVNLKSSIEILSVEKAENFLIKVKDYISAKEEGKNRIAPIYDQGVQHYNDREYKEAIEKFKKVFNNNREYESVQWYLREARKELEKSGNTNNSEN